MRDVRVIAVIVSLCMVGIAYVMFTPASSQTVSNSYPEWFERLDFVAADQQTVFNVRAVARSNFVEVFQNGLLQTQELAPATCAPACADYSSANVSGHTVVTFLQPLPAGTRVSLIYWR